MSTSKHQSIIYNGDSRYDNYIDPVTKNPFKNGEQVVVCKEKNSLLSSRSLKANDYQCPFCGKQLNLDLTIDGPIGKPNGDGKKYLPPQSPRPQSSSNVWIGLIVVMIFCFILSVSGVFASILGGSGTTSNPSPSSTRIRPTSTTVAQADSPKPRPTNTLRPQPATVNNNYAEISCAEIHKVNLRRTPGYIGKDDDEDSLYEVPCGEIVELLGPSQKVDGLTWWKISWNGYIGWIADHTGSGKVILDFDP